MNARRLFAVLAFASACDRSHRNADVEASGSRSTADAGGAVVAAASAAPSVTAVPRSAASWHGSYKSVATVLYVPPDWKNVHWNVKENATGIGEGVIAVTVDAASGRVHGTLDGPLGPAVLDGLLAEGKVTATIARRDRADRGFTGTLVGSLRDGRGEGTMNVSLAEADAIRTATFALSPDGVETAPH